MVHATSLLVLLIGIALLSGSYPAFILSGFKPASALKGKIRASVWSIGIRKGLVVFQFAVSIVLIVCSLVIYRQLQYMQQHDLGFKSSQTMVINFEGDNTVQQQYQTIRRQMLKYSRSEEGHSIFQCAGRQECKYLVYGLCKKKWRHGQH